MAQLKFNKRTFVDYTGATNKKQKVSPTLIKKITDLTPQSLNVELIARVITKSSKIKTLRNNTKFIDIRLYDGENIVKLVAFGKECDTLADELELGEVRIYINFCLKDLLYSIYFIFRFMILKTSPQVLSMVRIKSLRTKINAQIILFKKWLN
jgi:hypothetical protein